MKKDSNRNNLIQKQLKIITKKEEKLLKEPNDNYIKNRKLFISRGIDPTNIIEDCPSVF